MQAQIAAVGVRAVAPEPGVVAQPSTALRSGGRAAARALRCPAAGGAGPRRIRSRATGAPSRAARAAPAGRAGSCGTAPASAAPRCSRNLYCRSQTFAPATRRRPSRRSADRLAEAAAVFGRSAIQWPTFDSIRTGTPKYWRSTLTSAFGMACRPRQGAGGEALGAVGHAVAVAQRGRRLAEQGAEPFAEAVVVRPVGLHGRLGHGPGAVEEQQGAVVEDVGEAHQRRVGMVAHAVADVLGEVQRQRPHRAEQAEEAHAQPRRRSATLAPNDASAAGAKSSSGSCPSRSRFADRPQRACPGAAGAAPGPRCGATAQRSRRPRVRAEPQRTAVRAGLGGLPGPFRAPRAHRCAGHSA